MSIFSNVFPVSITYSQPHPQPMRDETNEREQKIHKAINFYCCATEKTTTTTTKNIID